ncbi:alpha/beta fold hydrolase [Halorhodospira halochloris]|uniref:alpha/beta fold hydrolase n=1 Tax=Halorhodospira halochloris TaxID=1052 RepID=UPI001EE8FF9A|nr:alpha/beta fold hydrolase [Halorhodospira halochloris]MCG5547315.1 alpha/beta fold hydrolase [Halorhodospira halochloris]
MVDLNYSVRGEGEPVVLLHGLYGSSGNLARVTRHLAKGCRVITPDLRNHGKSPHSPQMDYITMAADVAALLEREHIERAALLGHSMGGKVAMTMALTMPERVSCLIAADIAPKLYRRSHDSLISRLQAVDVKGAASRAEIDAQLSSTVEDGQVRQFLLTNLQKAQDGGYFWRIPLDYLANAVPEIEGFPALDGVYTGPALFVYGTRSEYFILERDEELVQKYFTQPEYAAIPGAGHWLHAENPQEFNRIIGAFLHRKGIFNQHIAELSNDG